jgi:hypothetical protein
VKEVCVALDNNGRRCRRRAVRVEQYHGEHEIYGYFNEPWPTWVRAALCPRHCEPPRIAASTRKEAGK